MNRWKGQVAVVTGASAGIGAAIAEQLVDAGLKVVGIARRKERLEENAKNLQGRAGTFYYITGDLTIEDDILKAFKWIKENVGPISILVNNAGCVGDTNLIDGNTKMWQTVLNTNVLAVCIATREAIADMRANNIQGHIIHINSLSGHRVHNVPGANISVYPASKYALTALTESLRNELNQIESKIKVSSISPGTVKTEINSNRTTEGISTEEQKKREEFFASLPHLYTRDLAEAVMFVLGTPPHVQIHELIIKPVGELYGV